ncbi:SDR family NAD(P)-dependent oxidoreductase [Idiomarina zobellii]|uniref:Dihydromonapterin reductase n=1 Tax=Idiomarina zobellii TaxID=86103 RepID=A0A837NJ44_9GAMM|nr:SDR family NAD(P)-dependent oxidoreductase [Idiomarina zobellii]KPD24921.1 short-chain dehydrogenase [Idiomarina zobellii]SDF32098.1 dihydromonapterin reductase / dihydrofolate reductase [Idiomarina zobellii]
MTKTALVTGAGRRFGFEVAKALIEDGYKVFAHYNSSKDGVDELSQLGAEPIQANFARQHDVKEMVTQIKKSGSKLDLLINNASCFFDNDSVDNDSEALETVFQVHNIAPYLLITGLQQQLSNSDNGLIINITDIYTDKPSTNYIAYCAAKAGLANMTQAFAKALAPDVRVNAIQPGPILFLPEHDNEHKMQVLDETPLQVEGGLEPMIDTVRFLRDNPFLTGESIKVDGGRALNL